MGRLKGWDHHLFKNHQVISSSPLQPLQCFEVFHKVDTEGLRRRPVIISIGTMTTLAQPVGVPRWNTQAQIIQKGQEILSDAGRRTELGNHKAFELGISMAVIKEEIQTTTKFLNLMFGVHNNAAKAELKRAKSLTCEITDVTSDRVKPGFLEYLVREPGARWKPDVSQPQLKWPHEKSGSTKVLWIVTEVKYATKIVISATESFSAGAEISVTPTPGLDVGGQGGIRFGRNLQGGWDWSSPSGTRFPFAFKATRLEYTASGNLLIIDPYPKIMPIRRGEGSDPKDVKRYFDPNLDTEYHMEGFFTAESSTDPSSSTAEETGEEAELVCLIIDGSESVQESTPDESSGNTEGSV